MKLGILTRVITTIAFLLCMVQLSPALTIEPGTDLWITPGNGQSSIDFADNPIPADFFGPGSEPFVGKVCLGGQPLTTTPPGAFGPTDLIIERLDTLDMPSAGDGDVVPIELVALSLQSCEPIQVTYGGGTVEFWQVFVTLSDDAGTTGQLSATKECLDGGTFDLQYQFNPKITFINLESPSSIEVFVPVDPIIIQHSIIDPFGYFYSFPSSQYQVFQSDGTVTVDHDNNPLTPEILVGPGSPNFFPGVIPLPCDLIAPSGCEGIETQLLESIGADFLLSILPPVQLLVPFGATCLPDGSCIITSATCALSIGGTYWGDGTTCDQVPCALPLPGIFFEQVDFEVADTLQENTITGRLTVDVPLLLSSIPADSGFINVETDLGWVIQNLKVEGTGKVTTYFQISELPGVDVLELLAGVDFSVTPLPNYNNPQRASYAPVGNFIRNTGGFENTALTLPPSPILPGIIFFPPLGPSERHTQPNASNVQAANDQCFPMGIANSLQYLEDRYGLPVPHVHAPGLKGDSTLVGQLDSLSNRNVTNRSTGDGIGFTGMMEGKFKYMKDNNLKGKVITKHQGHAAGGHNGDYESSGTTSKDESVNGRVTFEWICNELKKGEDVELGYRADAGWGHIVRVFECGKTLGVPWLGYVHDANQTDSDPQDTLGLETTRVWAVDLDGDSVMNFGSANLEVRLVVSESADTDRDSVTNGIDNAPNLYNPGQEDADDNGVGDVAEPGGGDLHSETIAPFDLVAGGTQTFGPFENPLPENPDHKDIWFLGTAINSSTTDTAKIQVSFIYKNGDGGTVTYSFPDTTVIPPTDTFEVFGAQQIDFCPDSVSVGFQLLEGALTGITGNLNHICYPDTSAGCCIGMRGNVDGSAGDGIDIADLVYFVNYAFGSPSGPAPPCFEEADANGDGNLDIADIVYLITFMFNGGPAPLPCP